MYKHNTGKKREGLEAYKGWSRILPTEDLEHLSLIMRVKRVYDSILGYQAQHSGTTTLTSQAFCKLAKLGKGLPDRTQLELLYIKLIKSYQASAMTLHIFIDALEEIAKG